MSGAFVYTEGQVDLFMGRLLDSVLGRVRRGQYCEPPSIYGLDASPQDAYAAPPVSLAQTRAVSSSDLLLSLILLLRMSVQSVAEMLKEADACQKTNPKQAEQLYRRILETSAQAQGSTAEREQNLRDQETALISLGKLYRDNRCARPSRLVVDNLTNSTLSDADGLAQVIILSRSFMSTTAKAKTAKLSAQR